MAIIVSDTSPIRALAHLNLLQLLNALFGDVIVPPKVADELEHPSKAFVPVNIQNRTGFTIVAPLDKLAVTQLMEVVDQGEAEAITLAGELHADVLLIDENTGRKIAQSRGLEITGVIGILLRAKKEGKVNEIKTLLDRLENELRFFMSPKFKAESLRSAGE